MPYGNGGLTKNVTGSPFTEVTILSTETVVPLSFNSREIADVNRAIRFYGSNELTMGQVHGCLPIG